MLNKITYERYYAGAAVYCGARKAIQLQNARVDVYDRKIREYKTVPLLTVDKIGIVCFHAIVLAPYMLPIALVKDAKALEVKMRGLRMSDFGSDEPNDFWVHLLS